MVQCPQCLSEKTWKDGLRSTNSGNIQRYLCRNCDCRFSEPKIPFDVTGQIFESSKASDDHSDSSTYVT